MLCIGSIVDSIERGPEQMHTESINFRLGHVVLVGGNGEDEEGMRWEKVKTIFAYATKSLWERESQIFKDKCSLVFLI